MSDSNRIKSYSRKDSTYSLEQSQSRSLLSLSNPYQKIMDKQVSSYKPILQDCQMIVSKKIQSSKHEPQPFTVRDLEDSKVLQEIHQNRSNKKPDRMGSSRERASK